MGYVSYHVTFFDVRCKKSGTCHGDCESEKFEGAEDSLKVGFACETVLETKKTKATPTLEKFSFFRIYRIFVACNTMIKITILFVRHPFTGATVPEYGIKGTRFQGLKDRFSGPKEPGFRGADEVEVSAFQTDLPR